jgi:cell division transport system permease protein
METVNFTTKKKNGMKNYYFLLFLSNLYMEQLESTKVNKGKATYIYSIIGVALVLFLLGSLGWLVINAGQLSNSMKEKIEINVELNDNNREEKGLQLKKIIEEQAFTKQADYVSKEKASEIFKLEVGEEFNQVLDINPLYASINIHLYSEYMNADSIRKIEAFLKQSNVVRSVYYQKNLVDIMNSNVKRIGLLILVISLFLIFSVIILIDNTIRLAMYSNRFLIKTMQMVGATRWFIAKPFNIRSVINGIISAVIAIIGVLLLKAFAESLLPELKTLASIKWMFILCSSILALGIVISLTSTHRSVIKYLRTQIDDLY